MKKVLFGIIALSMAAFAANPEEVKVGAASVPVKVLAEVIAPTDALVITDEAGNIIGAEGIVLDHGIHTSADGKHTTAPFRFKVKRLTAGGSQAINGTLTVAIKKGESKDATTEGQPITLGKVGGGTTNTLISNLKLENGTTTANVHGYTADMGTTAKEHTGEITSTVNFTAAAPGKYESGLTETRPELVVTIAANS
ncbi:hypothetical protein OQE61_04740 [Cetobacterium somerae]|uniref:hypothetical protein n=1 Tax=Cetobacterium somerae TaxID=188913 RepID=UPI002255F640|nr:hypothetical protein [Cetobacterium somerae]MCX3066797.1 hypothetical protein [Cetobacterium somerae]